ncbi:MAG: hypothetical protein BMS9Abin39_0887 [Ignavibacteria bacterium]|jgi:peptidyl-prolyl cis-trans isomerase SurA|nr:MAG: hypothetical protein BMS9Abin39_0887 [Ignavibacteria bacterium]
MIKSFFSFILRILVFFMVLNVSISSQTIVGEFGKYKITLDEFEYAYAKNVGGRVVAEKDSFSQYKDFMNLYLNFRMKLRNAYVRGFDTDPALIKELIDYKEQIGKSYIIEKQIIEPGLKSLYERKKEELRVSQIMIRPGKGSNEEAFEKANTILDSIKNGASFEELAEKYSDDNFSAPNGGDIFFVTAGQLPIEFEDAMYTLQPGEIYSEPVKTSYGFHLIKITKRQPRTPKVRARHILINYLDESGEIDTLTAKQTADTVIAKLNDGADFVELVAKYSDDTGTKSKGGDLGFFERRQMVRPFDEVAFTLDVNEISDPVQTNFGFHIIEVTEKENYPSFESDKDNLKKIYEKQRYKTDYANYIENLKTKYNFTLNEQTVDMIIDNSDSIRFGVEYPNLDLLEGKNLFTYANKTVSAKEFLNDTNLNSEFTGKPVFIKTEVMKAVNKFSENNLIYLAAMDLEKEDPNFSALMDEYKDGVYIFKLQEDEVWNKLHVDSTDVYNYWEEHKEDYSIPTRITFGEIFTMKDTLIDRIFRELREGADFDSLAALYTERPRKKKDKGRYQLQDADFSDLSREANKIKEPGNFSAPVLISGGFAVYFLYERDPARLKTFNEARAEIAGLIQEQESKRLADKYISDLVNIYQPVTFYDELHKAFKSDQDN